MEEEIKSSRSINLSAIHSIKQGIWVYYILIIFEGALRKWFLPGLADPLLVIRDPIAIWLVFSSLKHGVLSSNIYLNAVVIIGLVGLYTGIFVGHGNVVVALYGARILLLHFPLIFVIGRVFNRDDILKMAKFTLYLSIPMALLISMQFYSPQSAWVNRGLAGDIAGAGFAGSGDFFRPPGTFSFTIGNTLFFGWLAPFVFYYWFNVQQINRLVLIAASGAMLIAIPFSISRALLFECLLTLSFAIVASMGKRENLNKIMLSMIVGLIVLVVLSQTSFFNTATGAFMDRFTTANESEGGLVKGVIANRFFGGMFEQLASSAQQPFWGYGIGMGTNVGSMLLTGTQTFLISEGEWGRVVGELGPFMGIVLIIFRIALTMKIAIASFRRLAEGDLLPWLLLSFGFIILSQGGWAQPTTLGFFVMIGGLLIASLKGENKVEEYPEEQIEECT